MIAANTPESSVFSQGDVVELASLPLENSLAEACWHEPISRMRTKGFGYFSDNQIQHSIRIAESRCVHLNSGMCVCTLAELELFIAGTTCLRSNVQPSRRSNLPHLVSVQFGQLGEMLAKESALNLFTCLIN